MFAETSPIQLLSLVVIITWFPILALRGKLELQPRPVLAVVVILATLPIVLAASGQNPSVVLSVAFVALVLSRLTERDPKPASVGRTSSGLPRPDQTRATIVDRPTGPVPPPTAPKPPVS